MVAVVARQLADVQCDTACSTDAQTQRTETRVQGSVQTHVGARQHADTTQASAPCYDKGVLPAFWQRTCVGQRAEEVLHQLRVKGADALCGDVDIEAQEWPPRQILQYSCKE